MKRMDYTLMTAGVDTGKDKLDVAIHGSPDFCELTNDDSGHQQLSQWLADRKVERVGIEASGGYQTTVVGELRRAGFQVIIFQPNQVRCFAGFKLQRAKNDRIDAALIAKCAAYCEEVREPCDTRLEEFAEPLTLIDQLSEDIARWKTRLEHARQTEQRDLIKEQIKCLSQLIAHRRAALLRAIKSHNDLAKRYSLIESVQGIGLPTALTLLIRMPELGNLTREQIAALAGLAPFDHDTGRFKGQRRIAGGRSRARRAICAAAFPAAQRWNPILVALYKRLIEAKKTHKQALIACARKLLIMVNAVVARGTPWVKTETAS